MPAPRARPRAAPGRRLSTDAHGQRESHVLRWLLSPSQPAARYRTLRELLDRPETDPQVVEARKAIPRRGWARALLARQARAGHWLEPADLYRPKYLSTIWNVQTLADLGVTREHPAMARACELFLDQYARDDGGFDSPGSESSEICVSGNVTRALLLAGYGDEPKVKGALRSIVAAQFPDGGWHCWPPEAKGRGTIDSWEGLKALSVVPVRDRTPEMKKAIARGAEFFLDRRVYREGGARYPPWERFHFPTHYYYDALVGLDMLTTLGFGADPRLDPALQLLEGKRRRDGTWAMDRAHPDVGLRAGYPQRRTARPLVVERAGRPSRWITGTALAVQRRAARARAASGR
jgi:hypothetical protein